MQTPCSSARIDIISMPTIELKQLLSELVTLEPIIEKHEATRAKKGNYAFNIFNLSKDGTHRENFHSDILAAFLNPKGEHKQGDIYLHSFLRFLNDKHGASINIEDFQNSSVHREVGHLDISILDERSKKAIIFENKINGAPDMDNQLSGYYTWCTDKGYEVAAIVYMTKSGEKMAPPLTVDSTCQPINLYAFSDCQEDLVTGWITPAIALNRSEDTTSILYQYKKLLTFLAYDQMNNDTMNQFYAKCDDLSLQNRINRLKELFDRVPKFRTDQFVANLSDFSPFSKSTRHKDYYMLYHRYIQGEHSFKLDVWFVANGDAFIHFWINPGINEFSVVEAKIKAIGYENKMFPCTPDTHKWAGYSKSFFFSEYRSMSKIDNAILNFTKEFLETLKK